MSDRDARRDAVLSEINDSALRDQPVRITETAAERVLDALDRLDAGQGTE